MNPQIMIIEDETIIAEDIRESLTELGYAVNAYSSGEEALKAAEGKHPDLVLADINLGSGMDGIEAASRLRQDFHAAIIFMTAHGEGEIFERAKRAEPIGYMVKPVKANQLHAAIQVAWQNYQVQARLRQKQANLESTLGLMSQCVIYVDQNRKIETVNEAAATLLGKAGAELRGKLAGEVCKILNSTKQEIGTAFLDEALAGKTPENLSQAAWLETAKGEVAIACRISPIFDDSEKNTGAVIVLQEVREGGDAAPNAAPVEAEHIDKGIEDPVTGLPGVKIAFRELQSIKQSGKEIWIAALVFERYFNITDRYGTKTANDLLTFYGVHLGQELPGYRLFRWNGPTFLAIGGEQSSEGEFRRDLARVSASRIMKHLELNSRTALVSLSVVWELFCSAKAETVQSIMLQVDTFVAAQVGRQHLG